ARKWGGAGGACAASALAAENIRPSTTAPRPIILMRFMVFPPTRVTSLRAPGYSFSDRGRLIRRSVASGAGTPLPDYLAPTTGEGRDEPHRLPQTRSDGIAAGVRSHAGKP